MKDDIERPIPLKGFCLLTFSREVGRVTGEALSFVQEAKVGTRGKSKPYSLLEFLQKRCGRVNSLGSASLNDSSGLWGIGAVP